jgi:hypothetical protein
MQKTVLHSISQHKVEVSPFFLLCSRQALKLSLSKRWVNQGEVFGTVIQGNSSPSQSNSALFIRSYFLLAIILTDGKP